MKNNAILSVIWFSVLIFSTSILIINSFLYSVFSWFTMFFVFFSLFSFFYLIFNSYLTYLKLKYFKVDIKKNKSLFLFPVLIFFKKDAIYKNNYKCFHFIQIFLIAFSLFLAGILSNIINTFYFINLLNVLGNLPKNHAERIIYDYQLLFSFPFVFVLLFIWVGALICMFVNMIYVFTKYSYFKKNPIVKFLGYSLLMPKFAIDNNLFLK